MSPCYRKKPIIIEAIQYLGFEENGGEVEEFLGEDFSCHAPSKNEIDIRTLEGTHVASKGDFVICSVRGEHYTCKPDIFAEIYEEVS